MIIAVADMHLGSHRANKTGFTEFILKFLEPNQSDISRIVLLGDILDLWRKPNSQVLLENLDIMTKLGGLDMKKNYLIGNHDYAVFSLLNQSNISVPPESTGVLDRVSKTLELTHDGLQMKFIHGHQVDYWPALQFYEIFSQAMCFVDIEDQELSEVWNIVYRFAESLPDNTRDLVREISKETQNALERKLAGPLDVQTEETGLYYEWDLLRKVSDFDDVANHYSKPAKEIEQFAKEWEQILKVIDNYPESTTAPSHLVSEMHQKRREAAALTVGLQENEFLIRGHSHSPYVDRNERVADAGCWLGSRGSYLVIKDGQVSVHEWKSMND